MRGFCKWLAKTDGLPFNPASELDLPRLERRLPRAVLSEKEVEQLLAIPDLADPIGLRDRVIMEVPYSTGLRRAELPFTPSDALPVSRRPAGGAIMMNVTREAERLLDAAMDLPEEERAELAAILSDSVGRGSSFDEIEAEWIAEAKRRLEDVRAGRATTIPSEDVERELEEIIAARENKRVAG